MMPKGVEHKELGLERGRLGSVKIPMMPKGVEHAEARAALAAVEK